MKLLIVEDNPLNLKLLRYLIKNMEIEVIVADDGEKAVQLAKEQLPDLIICDIQMPKLDGFKVIELLRSYDSTKYIKIIAVTAHAMVGDKEKILKKGFDGYFSKPINTREFRRTLLEFKMKIEKETDFISESK